MEMERIHCPVTPANSTDSCDSTQESQYVYPHTTDTIIMTVSCVLIICREMVMPNVTNLRKGGTWRYGQIYRFKAVRLSKVNSWFLVLLMH